MSGELHALLAAIAYGAAGAAISKGKLTANGDNGVALSVLTTIALTGILWSGWGNVPTGSLTNVDAIAPLAIFALAGLLSVVFGRVAMYRATERIGAVPAALLRRLIPVFALPIAFLLLGQLPNGSTLFGGVLVVFAAVFYLWSPHALPKALANTGLWLGVGSAAFYAAAYTLRGLGLEHLPDPALGTFVGAMAAGAWLTAARIVSGNGSVDAIQDRGPWHWIAALSLSIGQLLQFFAIQKAPVVTVATIGTLEVFITAGLAALFGLEQRVAIARLLISGAIAAAGTALLIS